MVYVNSTVIPISSSANTATTILTADIIAGNATAFPQLGNVAKNFDKISWHKVRMEFVPSLPTTAGGAVGMYFDTDRTDTPPASLTDAMQNLGSRMSANWDRIGFNIPRKMLQVNKWYTTLGGAGTTAATNNTFTSPGRMHVLLTPQPGVTYTTATVIGYLHIDFVVELGFPTNPVDTTIPTRRVPRAIKDDSFLNFTSDLIGFYNVFRAGCSPEPDFYTFVRHINEFGELDVDSLDAYDPDFDSRNLISRSLPHRPTDFSISLVSVKSTRASAREATSRGSLSSCPMSLSPIGEDELDYPFLNSMGIDPTYD